MKLITGVLNYQNNTLVVGFPCTAYDLSGHLGSIGIRTPAAEIPYQGTEQIEVKLAAEDKIGEMILSKLMAGDTLAGLNLACQEIAKACPYGYDEFLDMLNPKPADQFDRYRFYQSFETVLPSTATGTKFLLEETHRYHATMENYRKVCEADEAEEARNIREVNRMFESGEDEWER